MPVTIIFKTSLPIGADAKAFKKIKLCKANGVSLPLSPDDDAANEALLAQHKKARKFETKLFAKCEEAAGGNLKAFTAVAKTYLSNKRCLLVFLFIVNARRPLQDRIPLDQLIALANEYDILKNLNEPARVWQQPKACGNRMRVVCSFGPVAHAAQLMVSKLLRLKYQPQPFQFAKLHFSEKVQQAMTVIKEKGYAHVTEIDIKDFFPSFTEEALMKALPLPKEAIRQIVLAKKRKLGATSPIHTVR